MFFVVGNSPVWVSLYIYTQIGRKDVGDVLAAWPVDMAVAGEEGSSATFEAIFTVTVDLG